MVTSFPLATLLTLRDLSVTCLTIQKADNVWNFDNSYLQLPEIFFQTVTPTAFPNPELVVFQPALSEQLGLGKADGEGNDPLINLLKGTAPAGAATIAQAYAGHQFGGFTMLGDGRAMLVGELVDPENRRWDIQLKGSGTTPYSRQGDGRATLGPMLREFLISEAMHALGISSTRSLAVLTTGETVYRSTPQLGAVLVRVARSHLRVGTFQFAAAIDAHAKTSSPQTVPGNLVALADYAIQRHDPDLANQPDRYLRFLDAVVQRQARLVAQWQGVGFVHGVLNTDNVSIAGETIDYGPCAFMDYYDPDTVFSSIDHGGRYAYGNQPAITQWNLTRLAESLLPLIDSDPQQAVQQATQVLETFPQQFQSHWQRQMNRKLGLRTDQPDDASLIEGLLNWMHRNHRDFTNTFDDLSTGDLSHAPAYQDASFVEWKKQWQQRLTDEGQTEASAREWMLSVNPAVIPRNLHVEVALTAATVEGDWVPFQKTREALAAPFQRRNDYPASLRTPAPRDSGYRTFCGT